MLGTSETLALAEEFTLTSLLRVTDFSEDYICATMRFILMLGTNEALALAEEFTLISFLRVINISEDYICATSRFILILKHGQDARAFGAESL